jgi:co-chaperonin GroES (HSP10)
MKVKAVADQIVLKCKKVEDTTKSGIIKDKKTIEAEKKESFKPYEVLDVGSKVEGINIGDKVFLKANTITTVLPFDLPTDPVLTSDGVSIDMYQYGIVAFYQVLCIIED